MIRDDIRIRGAYPAHVEPRPPHDVRGGSAVIADPVARASRAPGGIWDPGRIGSGSQGRGGGIGEGIDAGCISFRGSGGQIVIGAGSGSISGGGGIGGGVGGVGGGSVRGGIGGGSNGLYVTRPYMAHVLDVVPGYPRVDGGAGR